MATDQNPISIGLDRDDAARRAPAPQQETSSLSERWLDIRERLALADGASEPQRVEWICSDQIRDWQAGRRIPAEAYLALHPLFPAESEAVFEVVYNEFLLRESLGERPCLEEFVWRFPDLADRLARQLALHRALSSDDGADGEGVPAPRARKANREGDDGPTIAGAPRIPGYRILGELGRGGAGVVYKARQLTLDRLVALKVIQAGHRALPGAVERFHAEAEATARFQHPNIIQVHEVGEHEGLGYLALEYAAGGSLEAAIAGTPWAPTVASALIEELARAIHYAHERGIVHRDLKPANVVMTSSRTPKITDFGLAKLLEQNECSTVSGTILGTPSYMAPEQFLGSSHEITPAADVYALGAMLYEALTGRPPFKGPRRSRLWTRSPTTSRSLPASSNGPFRSTWKRSA
ncbi:serine/threonine-protein kinase [Paludisphaera borealis]|uniref:Serine/threonine-protein kinase StkP n=1 Tax=Paludisphaera borealis TaxID=1387353 RepID=A0A1U7CVF8_9BACT|nr:serine/threonine-protein kinase [Paludisphaera borealis]APW62937.1 Serine/threonine-protein kinase StkP [Paludisphaera borealis]